jgi:hypothetical protein
MMSVYEQIDWPLGNRNYNPDDSCRCIETKERPYWGIRVQGNMGDNFIYGRIIDRLRDDGVPVLSDQKFYAEREPEREPDRTAAITFLAIAG